MNGQFQSYIKGYVIGALQNKKLATSLSRSLGLTTMSDVQRKLTYLPKPIASLGNKPERNMILLPVRLVDFALTHLKTHPVLFIVLRKEDLKLLQMKQLPRQHRIFNYVHAYQNVRLSKNNLQSIVRQILLATRRTKHELFATAIFRQWAKHQMQTHAKHLHLQEHILRTYPIGGIVSNTELANPWLGFSLVARKLQIPFIYYQQNTLNDHSVFPAYASRFLLWGTAYAHWYQSRGLPAKQIYTVGHWEYDQLYPYQQQSSTSYFKRQINCPKEHLILLLTTQPYGKAVSKRICSWLMHVVQSGLPVTFVVKRHPNDTFNYQPYLLKQRIILSPKGFSLQELIAQCDAMLTISSTTSLEAALQGKPLFILQPEPMPYHYEYCYNDFYRFLAHHQAGYIVSQKDELLKGLRAYCQAPNFKLKLLDQGKQFLDQLLTPAHEAGRAAREKLLEIIEGKA